MAVKIRLRRMGAKKAPFYRIVVADSRYPARRPFHRGNRVLRSDWKSLLWSRSMPEKAKKWIANGAQPTDTVKALFKKHGVL